MIDPWFLRELQTSRTEGDGTEGLARTYRSVDTCAAEFEAQTPYFYSAHERRAGSGREAEQPALDDGRSSGDWSSVVILGSGPNRIGQGIEFDYAASTRR